MIILLQFSKQHTSEKFWISIWWSYEKKIKSPSF